MIAVDHLTAAVMDALSSGYCPASKTHFMLRLLGAVAIFCGIGFGLICAAFRSMNAPQRAVAYTGAAVLYSLLSAARPGISSGSGVAAITRRQGLLGIGPGSVRDSYYRIS